MIKKKNTITKSKNKYNISRIEKNIDFIYLKLREIKLTYTILLKEINSVYNLDDTPKNLAKKYKIIKFVVNFPQKKLKTDKDFVNGAFGFTKKNYELLLALCTECYDLFEQIKKSNHLSKTFQATLLFFYIKTKILSNIIKLAESYGKKQNKLYRQNKAYEHKYTYCKDFKLYNTLTNLENKVYNLLNTKCRNYLSTIDYHVLSEKNEMIPEEKWGYCFCEINKKKLLNYIKNLKFSNKSLSAFSRMSYQYLRICLQLNYVLDYKIKKNIDSISYETVNKSILLTNKQKNISILHNPNEYTLPEKTNFIKLLFCCNSKELTKCKINFYLKMIYANELLHYVDSIISYKCIYSTSDVLLNSKFIRDLFETETKTKQTLIEKINSILNLINFPTLNIDKINSFLKTPKLITLVNCENSTKKLQIDKITKDQLWSTPSYHIKSKLMVNIIKDIIFQLKDLNKINENLSLTPQNHIKGLTRITKTKENNLNSKTIDIEKKQENVNQKHKEAKQDQFNLKCKTQDEQTKTLLPIKKEENTGKTLNFNGKIFTNTYNNKKSEMHPAKIFNIDVNKNKNNSLINFSKNTQNEDDSKVIQQMQKKSSNPNSFVFKKSGNILYENILETSNKEITTQQAFITFYKNLKKDEINIKYINKIWPKNYSNKKLEKAREFLSSTDKKKYCKVVKLLKQIGCTHEDNSNGSHKKFRTPCGFFTFNIAKKHKKNKSDKFMDKLSLHFAKQLTYFALKYNLLKILAEQDINFAKKFKNIS